MTDIKALSAREAMRSALKDRFAVDATDADLLAILTALSAAGFAIVPVEPTEKMMEADEYATKITMRRIWRAVITAAKGTT